MNEFIKNFGDELKKYRWFFFVFTIFALCIIFITPSRFQNDTFSAIKVGERIVNEGFPTYDNFSIHEGLTFTYPHLLFDVIVYSIYNILGFAGLYLFLQFLYLLLMCTMYFVTSKLCNNKIVAFLLIFPSLILINSGLAVRAQVISYIFLLFEVFFIEKLLESGKLKYIICLILLSFLIINFHVAVWPFYFVLYLPYLVNLFKIKFLRVEFVKYKHLKLLFIPLILSFVLGWLTPLGFDCYTYSLKSLSSSENMSNIAEHQSPTLKSDLGIKSFIYIFFIYSIFIFSKSKFRLTDISMLFGLTLMTLISVRHFNFLLLFAPIYISNYVINFLKRCKVNLSLDKICDIIFSIKGIIVTSVILFSIFYNFRYNLKSIYVYPDEYPMGAATYINSYLDKENIRLFSHYNFGSYLVLNDIKTFIDSRCDLYMDSFSPNSEVLKDFFDTVNFKTHYKYTFEKYDITHVLVYADSPLCVVLQEDENAKQILRNGNFVLYEWLG